MKLLLLSLFVAMVLLVAGCAQAGGKTELPKEIKYEILPDNVLGCLDAPRNYFPEQNPYFNQTYYPKDNIIKKDCQVYNKYKNKVIIGKTLQLGGCLGFNDEIKIIKDDQNKKVLITFVINSAGPYAICTMDLKLKNVWLAIDYIDDYKYEIDEKTIAN